MRKLLLLASILMLSVAAQAQEQTAKDRKFHFSEPVRRLFQKKARKPAVQAPDTIAIEQVFPDSLVVLRDSIMVVPDSLAFPEDSIETFTEDFIPEEFVTVPGQFRMGLGAPVDTLDIGDGTLQIVIKDDHSWYYIKNPVKLLENEVFKEAWSENVTNPYNVSLSDIPARNVICLVDSASTFVAPHQRAVFSKFGYRRGRRHQGVDLPLSVGTPVYAAFDGRVRVSQYTSGYGNLIVIRHENGLETYYGHLSKRNYEPGDWVHAGDVIGLGGSTGRSTGPHLHFETRYKGYAFDPQWIADYETGKLRSNVFVLRRSYMSPSSKYVPETIDEEEEIYGEDERIEEEEARIAAEKAAMRWHTVRSGETISHIAAKYHISQSKIQKLNPKLNINRISIGQKIRIN